MLRTILIPLLLSISFFCSATAEVPQRMNYQGRLTDDLGNALTTTADLTFSIFSDSSGTTVLWAETHAAVAIENGLFSVLLGQTVDLPAGLFDGQIRYLGLQVDGGPLPADLIPFVSTPYSLHAGLADTAAYAIYALAAGSALHAASADTADYAYAGPGSSANGWVDDGSKVRLETANDNVGIGTSTPSEQLVVGYDIGGYGGKYIVSGAEFLADVCGYKMGFSNNHHATLACNGNGALFALHTRESGVNYNNTLVARQGRIGIGVIEPAEPLVIGRNIGSYSGNRLVIGDDDPGVGTGLVIGEDSNNRSWILWDTDDNTLSIGSKEAGVNQGNAITIGGGTIELFDDAIEAEEILDEPGIGRYAKNSEANIYTNWTTICEKSCTFPASGYVVVLAVCEYKMFFADTHLDFGVSLNAAAAPHIYTTYFSDDDLSGDYYDAFSFHEVFSVSPGTNTFSLAAKSQTVWAATSWDVSMTVMFFPTAYGTVSGIAGLEDDQPDAASSAGQPMLYHTGDLPTAGPKTNERPDQLAALRAEFEAELAVLREEIAELKGER